MSSRNDLPAQAAGSNLIGGLPDPVEELAEALHDDMNLIMRDMGFEIMNGWNMPFSNLGELHKTFLRSLAHKTYARICR